MPLMRCPPTDPPAVRFTRCSEMNGRSLSSRGPARGRTAPPPQSLPSLGHHDSRAQRRSSCPRAPAPDDPVATRTRSPSFELGTIALTVAASTRPSRSHRARYRNSPCEPGRGRTGHQGRQAQRTPRRPSHGECQRSKEGRHESCANGVCSSHQDLPPSGTTRSAVYPRPAQQTPWNRLLVFVSSSHAPKRGCCARSGMRRERRCPSQADRLVGRRR
jgi:hypothetical protein